MTRFTPAYLDVRPVTQAAMFETPDGRYVLFEDFEEVYKALESAAAALEAAPGQEVKADKADEVLKKHEH